MLKSRKLQLLSLGAFLLFATHVNATILTLGNWNTLELQSSNDKVTVILGADTFGSFTCSSNSICVHWTDGVGTTTPTPKAIITFAYTDSGASTAPATTSETGGSTAWAFNGAGNADGFGSFERNNDKGPGNENTAGTTNWLVFGLTSLPSSFTGWHFAAHVQYNSNCSGWVSDLVHSNPTSNSNCGTTIDQTPGLPPRVPEPSGMILFGAGLIGLAAWRRRRAG